jgi:hypothetical protein
MRRRVALALFTALAVLAVPAAATALAHTDTTDSHAAAAAGITLANRHATVVHVGVVARRGNERRAQQGPGVPLAVFGEWVGAAPASAWAHLASTSSSPTGEVPPGTRPRAPPAVV